MDTPLPSSIEAYLSEAGFSGTEIVVLRKLLEEDALTLRELAAKTGKSTGVLDQAVKKLIKKRILTREIINETPKYILKSLQTVVNWMEEDMALKQEMLKRKHENFESFVRSLTVGKKRPEMEYFEGLSGIKQAYMQLLDRGNDIIQYGPIVWATTEDPLRDFWVEYFRERRRRGIFSRVITNDTPLGRRFQSRDPFEYRKTVLVEPDTYPFNFEKVIIGDTVACFQLEDERACFIKYAELAQSERVFFERLWNKKVASEQTNAEAAEKADEQAFKQSINPQPTTASFSTKTMSQLREFFLSRASILTFVALGALSALLTYGLYRRDVEQSTRLIQERIRSIAATAAPQFEAADLEAIHTLQDAEKPEYKKLVYQLNLIRNQNPGVKYAYLMRPKSGTIWEFIADADAIDPEKEIDENGNGKIDPEEESTYPGLQYETYDALSMDKEPAYVALEKPIALDPYVDQWGELISGLAPVKDAAGRTVGVLGIDVEVWTIYEQINTNFAPMLYFLGLLLLFVLVRLAAFNRSLARDLMTICTSRKIHVTFATLFIAALALTYGLYRHNVVLSTERIRERALAIVTTAATQFDAADIEQIHAPEDMANPPYQRVMQKLQLIKLQNPDAKYIYIHRPTGLANPPWEVVVDVDDTDYDLNGDGKMEESEQMNEPGQKYPHEDPDQAKVMQGPHSVLVKDEWGEYWDVSAPIYNNQGKAIAALYVDVDVQEVYALTRQNFVPIIWFFGLLLLMILVRLATFNAYLFSAIISITMRRQVLLWLLFLDTVLLGATYGMYHYTLRLKMEETGKRLMAIAATAAPMIDADDLELLRFARDMKREEYQRVFRQLNEIRDLNPEITYLYIWRPSEKKGIWEFVVDADSNEFIPTYFDYNQDSVLDEADEKVSPGVQYDMSYSPKTEVYGMQKPLFEIQKVSDQWGLFLTGSAPIYDKQGGAVAVLGIDADMLKINEEIKAQYLPFFLVGGTIYLIILIVACLRSILAYLFMNNHNRP